MVQPTTWKRVQLVQERARRAENISLWTCDVARPSSPASTSISHSLFMLIASSYDRIAVDERGPLYERPGQSKGKGYDESGVYALF